ncbi:MAG: hypothetical protein WD053_07280 [Gracilimonas sp.]
MKFKATYLFGIILLLFSAGVSQNTFAQPSLGVVWDTPTDTATAKEQLHLFSELGVTHLEIDHSLSDPMLSVLANTDLTILVRSDNYYLTLSKLQENREQLTQEYIALAEQFRSILNVGGLGLLSHSQTQHSSFSEVFEPVLDTLSAYSNKSLYYYHRDEWFSFNNPVQPFGTLYSDQDYRESDLSDFHSVMQSFTAGDANRLLFVHSEWLLDATEQYPELSNSLIEYRDNQTWELPLPDGQAQSSPSNWMVFILLVLWVALALQVKYLPYVRPMILRYFLAHRFFVDDILHYRERYFTSGILMMVKHAIFGGLTTYIVAQILFSEFGVAAFYHHLPWIAITGTNYFSFFFFGLILVLLTQLIALLWLHLPAKNLEHFSQTINLYSGIFYLDYLIITLMTTLFTAGIGTTLNLILASIYVIIWFGAFNLAAFDASKNMGSNRTIYLLLTIGLHTTLSIAIVLFVLLNTEIFEILDLAISL